MLTKKSEKLRKKYSDLRMHMPLEKSAYKQRKKELMELRLKILRLESESIVPIIL
jgi:hypothetical protein